MSKVRKALTAFLAAAAGAVIARVTTDGTPTDSAGWLALVGAAVGVGLVAAYAVWRVPNAPAVTPPAPVDDAAIRRY